MKSLADLLNLNGSLFNTTNRLLHLDLGTNGRWDSHLILQQATGSEGLNETYRYTLTCLSVDDAIELKYLIGLPARLSIVDDAGQTVERSGVVSSASSLGGDGGFARYQLVIEPPFALLRHRRTSRVFQDLSVPDIVKQILSEHQAGNAAFASVQGLDLHLSQEHTPRRYTLQYRETEFDFITRLLAEEGISWRFDHPVSDTPHVSLVLFDDPYKLPVASQDVVKFHRADATEAEDALTGWDSVRAIGSSAVHLASYDYQSVNTQHSEVTSSVTQGKDATALQSTLVDYDPQTHYYGDSTEQDRYTQLRQAALDAARKTFNGSGTLRGLMAGTWFRLDDHPAHESDPDEAREFVVKSLTFTAVNNLGLKTGETGLRTEDSGLSKSGRAERAQGTQSFNLSPDTSQTQPFRVEFEALRRGLPVIPDFAHTLASKPKVHGVQTATVVGPAGEEIHTDSQGRIKIQFHWQREAEHPDFGAGLDDRSSCWVRFALPSAGQSFGHQFIPRIGQEVLVDFVEGDIDRPIVTGVLYNGSHPTPTFGGAGSLPANKTLSGIKSKEVHGSQYNQLLFDDSTGELRTQLSTEHAKTQLNLGYLIHPRTEGKGSPRGNGFELRTDAHGAIRANGLFMTTQTQPSASGKQLDREHATSQLEAARTLEKSLADAATHQLADSLDTQPNEQQAKTLKDWEHGTNTESGNATQSSAPSPQSSLLVQDAPAGILHTSGDSLTQTAAHSINQIAQQDIQHTAGKRWLSNVKDSISLFVHGIKDKVSLKLIAAQGNIQTQAQSGSIEETAARNLTIQAHEKVTLNAGKELLMTAGGAYIRMADGNIEIHAPDEVSRKGADHEIGGPASLGVSQQGFPHSDVYHEAFRVSTPATKRYTDLAYRLQGPSGLFSANTLDKGMTPRIFGSAQDPLDFDLRPHQYIDPEEPQQ